MKVMALDYGDARTGVAVSDPSGMIVGFTTVSLGVDLPGKSCRQGGGAGAGKRAGTADHGFPQRIWTVLRGQERISTGNLRRCWSSEPVWRWFCGMSAGPPLRRIISCRQAGRRSEAAPKKCGCGCGIPDPRGISSFFGEQGFKRTEMILDRSVALCAGNSGPDSFFPQLCNPCENQKAAKESAEQIQLRCSMAAMLRIPAVRQPHRAAGSTAFHST